MAAPSRESPTATVSCPLCDATFETTRGRSVHLNHSHSDDAYRQVLADSIRTLRDRLGRVPTTTDVQTHASFSITTYYNHFESYAQVCRHAGLTPPSEQTHSATQITTTDLLADINRIADELDRVPTPTDIETHSRYSKPTYIYRFGSIREAIDAAGFAAYPAGSARNVTIDYGPQWEQRRQAILERDNYRCRSCTRPDDHCPRSLHVHHIRPAVTFGAGDPDVDTNYAAVNAPSNLITLCPSCHNRFEGQWTDATPAEFAANARTVLETTATTGAYLFSAPSSHSP